MNEEDEDGGSEDIQVSEVTSIGKFKGNSKSRGGLETQEFP
jgi:hypothetical protein